MKPRTKAYPKDWMEHCRDEAALLTVEKRQEFIDYMSKEHLTIGHAAKKADLNFDEACGIMQMQIKEVSYFDTKAKVLE